MTSLRGTRTPIVLTATLLGGLLVAACGPSDAPSTDTTDRQPVAEPEPVETVPDRIEMGGAKSVTTFFITSVGPGHGGDLGGLAGADAHCQGLAEAEYAGDHTWRAYLSTTATASEPAVHARDRIGSGPWYAFGGRRRVAQNVAELHGDTLEQARLGNALGKQIALTEKGTVVNGIGDSPNQHDMLTGSRPDGRPFTDGMDHTCSNWTSTSSTGSAQVGHSLKQGGGNGSWNSSHPRRGCSQENLVATGGVGLFYCFAID